MASHSSSAAVRLAAALSLCALLLLTVAAALPNDELASLRSENARLRAELLAMREQNGTPTKVPPTKQNLAGSKPNIVILFGDVSASLLLLAASLGLGSGSHARERALSQRSSCRS
jgi:hypothetical protein